MPLIVTSDMIIRRHEEEEERRRVEELCGEGEGEVNPPRFSFLRLPRDPSNDSLRGPQRSVGE